MKLFGIRNCDTVKKARKWLDEAGVAYEFHDFKKQGLTEQQLDDWLDVLGWEPLINRRGTTWRKLPETVRDTIDAHSARAVMLENPSIIKRPVVEQGDRVFVGFDADQWAQTFTQLTSGAHQ